MVTPKQTGCYFLGVRRYSLSAIVNVKVLLTFLFISLFSFRPYSQTVDFHQARNHFQNNYAIDWVSGILNATHTDYFEGVGIAQRVVFTNLTGTSHTATFKVLAAKGGKHAYDFLMSWEQAWKTARDIGNGSLNELATLSLDNGATINELVAWKDALTTTAKENITGDKNATPSQLDAAFTVSARGTLDGQTAILGDDVGDRITCFEGVYGTRDFEIQGNAAINSASITFTGYSDDNGDTYAGYTLAWNSTSPIIAVRFAGHPAVGVGLQSCIGYGQGKGAGSISGGPYHFKLLTLDGASLGEQDNQLMSGAIKIPPLCGFTGPTEACPDATLFQFQYVGGLQSAGAALQFTISTNTANVSFTNNSNPAVVVKNATADASGNYTLDVYPAFGGLVAGGDFQVSVVATKDGESCSESATVTHIEKVEVTASATPDAVNLNVANPHTQLNAVVKIDDVALTDAEADAQFSFHWSVSPATGVTLSADNVRNPTATFHPTSSPVITDYTFTVTVDQIDAPACSASDDVDVSVSGGGSCPGDITGPTSVCEEAQGLTFSSASLASLTFPVEGITYRWSIVPAGAADITSATDDVASITVNAKTTDFKVRLTLDFANPEMTDVTGTGCELDVDVHACGSNCTLTQGFFGSTNGKDCVNGMTAVDLINSLLASGQIEAGLSTGRSVIVGTSQASVLNNIMPGGGTPSRLKYDGHLSISSDPNSAFGQNYLTNVGSKQKPSYKINNVLLAQTITLALNMRYDGTLANTEVPTGTFTTYARASCPSGDPVYGTAQSFTIPGSVNTYLGAGATVEDLLDLANAVLSGGDQTRNNATVTPADVNNAVDAINKGFDKCRTTEVPPAPVLTSRMAPRAEALTEVNSVSVNVYPNPFSDVVRFTINSKTSGNAELTVFNILGQKISTVYSGYIQANKSQIVEYRAPAVQQNLVYVMRIGNEQVAGKLQRVQK